MVVDSRVWIAEWECFDWWWEVLILWRMWDQIVWKLWESKLNEACDSKIQMTWIRKSIPKSKDWNQFLGSENKCVWIESLMNLGIESWKHVTCSRKWNFTWLESKVCSIGVAWNWNWFRRYCWFFIRVEMWFELIEVLIDVGVLSHPERIGKDIIWVDINIIWSRTRFGLIVESTCLVSKLISTGVGCWFESSIAISTDDAVVILIWEQLGKNTPYFTYGPYSFNVLEEYTQKKKN